MAIGLLDCLWTYAGNGIPGFKDDSGEQPGFKGNHRVLMISLIRLVRSQRLVRESAWIAHAFGAIFGFWSTMAFFLRSPYNYSLSVIGLFELWDSPEQWFLHL